jgi:hypothetical protein
MINLERAGTEAKLRGDQEELKLLEVRADAIVADLRGKLDPYADSIVEIETESCVLLAGDLNRIKERAIFLKRKIVEYETALYGKRSGID